MARADSRRLAEERSLALHRAIAERVRARPAIIADARRRVRAWRDGGILHPRYAAEWEALLARDVAALCAALVEEGEPMATLRSMTPFAGVVEPRARWRLWREVREWLEQEQG